MTNILLRYNLVELVLYINAEQYLTDGTPHCLLVLYINPFSSSLCVVFASSDCTSLCQDGSVCILSDNQGSSFATSRSLDLNISLWNDQDFLHTILSELRFFWLCGNVLSHRLSDFLHLAPVYTNPYNNDTFFV